MVIGTLPYVYNEGVIDTAKEKVKNFGNKVGAYKNKAIGKVADLADNAEWQTELSNKYAAKHKDYPDKVKQYTQRHASFIDANSKHAQSNLRKGLGGLGLLGGGVAGLIAGGGNPAAGLAGQAIGGTIGAGIGHLVGKTKTGKEHFAKIGEKGRKARHKLGLKDDTKRPSFLDHYKG